MSYDHWNSYLEPDITFLRKMMDKTRKKKKDVGLEPYYIPESFPPRYLCPGCNSGQTKSLWFAHKTKGCGLEKRPRTCMCLVCKDEYNTRNKMLEHYMLTHHPITIETQIFENEKQFHDFRNELKESTGSAIYMRGGKTATNSTGYYKCQVNSNCTAFINTTTDYSGVVTARYCAHHSHQLIFASDNEDAMREKIVEFDQNRSEEFFEETDEFSQGPSSSSSEPFPDLFIKQEPDIHPKYEVQNNRIPAFVKAEQDIERLENLISEEPLESEDVKEVMLIITELGTLRDIIQQTAISK